MELFFICDRDVLWSSLYDDTKIIFIDPFVIISKFEPSQIDISFYVPSPLIFFYSFILK